MLTALIAFLIVALVIALVVVVARDPGPDPGEVARAYELAWDRLDFDALWTLSGPELRDQRTRPEFVAAKRRAYREQQSLAGLAREVELEEVMVGSEVAVVRTRVESRDGSVVRNLVRLAMSEGTWKVVGYQLQPGGPITPSAS